MKTSRRRTRRTPSGMTLVELLAVLVILGLMAGTLVVGFTASIGRGRHELAKTGIAVIVGKLELYRLDKGAWPSPDTGLVALGDGYARPADTFFLGADKMLDPWGRAYQLLVPGPDGHPFEVRSLGADGRTGGEGEDADVSSVNLRAGDVPVAPR